MAFARFKGLLKRSKAKNLDHYFDTEDWLDYIDARRTADDIDRDRLTAASLAKHFGILTKREMADLTTKLDNEFLLDWYEPHLRYQPHSEEPTMSRYDAAERDEDVSFVKFLADTYPAGREMSRSRIDSRLKRMFKEGPDVQVEKDEYEAQMEGVWRRMNDVQKAAIDRLNHERYINRLTLKSMIKKHERCEREREQAARAEQERMLQQLEFVQAQAVEQDRRGELFSEELSEHYERVRPVEIYTEHTFEREGPQGSSERMRRGPSRFSGSMYGNAGSHESMTRDGTSNLESDWESDLHDDEWHSDEEYIPCDCGCGRRVRDRRVDEAMHGNRHREQDGQRYGPPGRPNDDANEFEADRVVHDSPPPPYTAMPPEQLPRRPLNSLDPRNVNPRALFNLGGPSTSHPHPHYELEAPNWAERRGSTEQQSNVPQRFELPGDSCYHTARPGIRGLAMPETLRDTRREGISSRPPGSECDSCGFSTMGGRGSNGGARTVGNHGSIFCSSEPYFDYSVYVMGDR